MGYPRQGLKPCLHPRLVVLAEVRLVAQVWLRVGNTLWCGNITAILQDLWENRPRHIGLGGVRADSGFCLPKLLALWEGLRLPYVVMARLNQPIQKLLRGDPQSIVIEVSGTGVADLEYQPMSWPHPRRLVLIRYSGTGGGRMPRGQAVVGRAGLAEERDDPSLCFALSVTAGVLSHRGGKATVKLAVALRERGGWRRFWEKYLSPLPTCNAVVNRPCFTG